MTDVESRIGKYQTRGLLGQGGMGSVFRGYDPVLRREAAVKTLRDDQCSPETLARMAREARAAARLAHPNIVTLYDVDLENVPPYLAFELIEGEPLSSLLLERRFGPREAAVMFEKVARAVDHAHQNGVVHRDLKPGNILIDARGEPKVADFGVARMADADTALTQTGDVIGTAMYMAPEQAAGEPVDARSDVFALGATLYHVLTDKPPFEGEAWATIVRKVMEQDPVAPRMLNAALDADIETICLKAMEKEPAARYGSAGAMADDLKRYLENDSILARPVGAPTKLARKARKHPWVVGVTGFLILAIGIAIGTLLPLWKSAQRQLAQEREALLGQLRLAASTSLTAALEVRRAGKPDRMKEFLPAMKSAVDQVVKRDPTLAEPHYHLGRLYRAMMDFDAAMAEQELSLARDPSYGPSLYERAVLMVKRYDAERMAHRWKEIVGEHIRAVLGAEPVGPMEADDDELRVLRAAAIEALKRAEGAAGIPVLSRSCCKGLRLMLEENYDEAEKALIKAVNEGGYIEEAYEALEGLSLARGAPAVCVMWCRKGEDEDRGYFRHALTRAEAEILLGNADTTSQRHFEAHYQEAIATCDGVLKLEPGEPSALMSRARAHYCWGRELDGLKKDGEPHYAKAVESCTALLETRPPPHTKFLAHFGRGLSRVSLATSVATRTGGKDIRSPLYQGAIDDFGEALKLKAEASFILLRRADVRAVWGPYRTMDEELDDFYGAAVEDCDAVVRITPKSGRGYQLRGRVRLLWGVTRRKVGRGPADLFRLARRDFDRGLDLCKDHEDAHALVFLLRGVTAYYLSDWEAADADFTRATTIDASVMRPDVAVLWEECKQRLGKDF